MVLRCGTCSTAFTMETPTEGELKNLRCLLLIVPYCGPGWGGRPAKKDQLPMYLRHPRQSNGRRSSRRPEGCASGGTRRGSFQGRLIYTLRLKMPDGYKIPPHWHPTDEHVTVLSGTLYIGMGDKLDATQSHPFTAGGTLSRPLI